MSTAIATPETDVASATYAMPTTGAAPRSAAVIAGMVLLGGLGATGAALPSPNLLHFPSSSWVRERLSDLPVLFPTARYVTSPAPLVLEPIAPATAQLLQEVHADSGLTWDQIARYFGVSRRAVHLWASGGRMAAANEEMLTRLAKTVDSLKNLDLTSRRQALLATDIGANIIDAARAERSSRATDINRSPDLQEITRP